MKSVWFFYEMYYDQIYDNFCHHKFYIKNMEKYEQKYGWIYASKNSSIFCSIKFSNILYKKYEKIWLKLCQFMPA